jgi:hypothetical protein
MTHLCIDNKRILYITETWMPQKENKKERRESFILKETHFSMKKDMKQHGNTLT